MCLILAAHDCCPGYRLVVAANRDEFHDRAAAPATVWDDHQHIFGGRDLAASGTWLAIDRSGRFATITNVRSGRAVPPSARSRGLIVNDFLTANSSAWEFARRLAVHGNDYAGFNVLVYDNELCWYSNRGPGPERLAPGIYTLSNALLDTAWGKTERLRAEFGHIVAAQSTQAATVDHLLAALRDETRAADHELPQTGIGTAMERALSSVFIRGDYYGTRCSTVILINEDDRLVFHERRYDAAGNSNGDTRVEFELIPPAS